jgi:diaminohydroxyphosphoribosylaminopyrimidine deaminase/5-amino-6-(5-phosphoribosylamino)uracil reductase
MFHPEPPIIDPEWARFVDAARGAGPTPATGPLADLFGPLLQPPPADRPFVVAHLAQSLDGSIATASGGSQWISSDADLLHTHRLRSLCDAVLVGARTVESDDPMLTVRRCAGPSPLRVVLDPKARLHDQHRVFDGVLRTIVISAVDVPAPGAAERWVLPSAEGVIAPLQILEILHRAGIRRLLIEGGGLTVARFLQARLVDRLHLTIAPVLIGGGRPSLPIPLADSLMGSPRPASRVLPLGPDWLVDCDLRG